jgi:hypothetical protein
VTWTLHKNCSEFGGPTEDTQPLALAQKVYGRDLTCSDANDRGIFYFAACPSWVNGGKRLTGSHGQVFPNTHTPPALADLQPGAKVRFRYKGIEKVGVFLDIGPADWTGRYLDLGYPLARALGFDGTGDVEWTLEVAPMANPTKATFLAVARRWLALGIHEHNGDNRTLIGQTFGWNGVAWCAETVCVFLLEAGFKVTKNAGAHELAAQQVAAGWQKIAPTDVQGGDIVLFTWSHIGICEARRDANSIITIEGNHNDALMRAVRSNSSIAYGVRPPFGAGTATKGAIEMVVIITDRTKGSVNLTATTNHVRELAKAGRSLRGGEQVIPGIISVTGTEADLRDLVKWCASTGTMEAVLMKVRANPYGIDVLAKH